MDKYHTSGARFGAALIDGIIFLPISFLNNYLIEVLSSSAGLLILWTLVLMCIYQFYSIFLHGKYGQTFGKMAMGVKIVTYPEELPISYFQAFIRDLPYFSIYFLQTVILIATILFPYLSYNSSLMTTLEIVSHAGTVWVFIEIISMLFNDKRRAVHDFIAKTVVIKTG